MTEVGLFGSAPLLLLGILCLQSEAWGLWSLRHAAWAGLPLLLLALLLPLFSPLSSFLARGGGPAVSAAEKPPEGSRGRVPHFHSVAQILERMPGPRLLWYGVAFLCAFGVFFVLRQRLFLPPPEGLGDSLDLARRIPVFTELFGFLDSFDETLALYFRSRFFALLQPLGTTAAGAGAIWSCLWGGGYAVIVLVALRGRGRLETVFGLGLLLGTPSVQVFCGYVENYAEPMFFLCLILVWGGSLIKRPDRGDGLPVGHLVGIAAVAALGTTFHLVLSMMLPALGTLVFLSARTRTTFIRQALIASLSALFVIGPIWLYFLFLSPHPVSLLDSHVTHPPVYPLRELFGAKHLLDQANLWLLVAPGALLLAPITVRLAWSRDRSRTMPAETRTGQLRAFYAVCAGGFIFAMFVVNPLLGFPADWDLLSFFCLPTHFLLLSWLRPALENELTRSRSMIPIMGATLAGLLLTSAWIGRNMSRSAASDRNVAEATVQADGFLREIRQDRLYDRVPRARQKQFVKIQLFAYRAHRELLGMGTQETRALDARLTAAVDKYRRIATSQEALYRGALPAVYQELTAVNMALSGLKPSR